MPILVEKRTSVEAERMVPNRYRGGGWSGLYAIQSPSQYQPNSEGQLNETARPLCFRAVPPHSHSQYDPHFPDQLIDKPTPSIPSA
jgi:hypothetical protein